MKLWPQPADFAGFFLKRALGVEADEVAEQGVVAYTSFQPIGLQHGGVEFVMQLFQHANQALGVNGFFFGGQLAAFFQGFEHVVHARQRQARVGGLLAFSVGVDLFGQRADFFSQGWG